MKKRFKRTILLSAIALVIGGGIGWLQIKSENTNVIKKSSVLSTVAGIKIGGSFSLIDHNGKPVTEKDYQDYYKLIFFGFTFCPAICPMELQKITKVMDGLGDDNKKIQPLFISIDPHRDTVEILREYIAMFHPRLIGLTGSSKQIDHVKKAYRIYASKVENPAMDGYMMDHSGFTYLMSPDNELISVYQMEDTAEFIAKDLREIMSSAMAR